MRSPDMLIFMRLASYIATCMYNTAIDPFTRHGVHVARPGVTIFNEACRRWHTIAPAAPLAPRESPRPVFHRVGHVAERLATIAVRPRLFRQDRDRPTVEKHGDHPSVGKLGDRPTAEQPGDRLTAEQPEALPCGPPVRAVPVLARTDRSRTSPG